MTEQTQPPHVAKALASILGQVGTIIADKEVKHLRLKYASTDAVFDALRPLLAEEGVIMLPSVTKHDQDAKGVATVDMSVTFMSGVDGSTVSVSWSGCGSDKGDKGMLKAITSALRTCLLKTFLISTGDDPEATNSCGQPTDRRQRQQQSKPRQQARKPEAKQLTDEERRARANKRFEALTVLAKLTKDEARELRLGYCLDFEVERWSEIPVGKLEAMIAKMEKADEETLTKRFRARVAGAS
jgi:hypothetical protein